VGKKDHKVEVWTSKGKVEERWVDAKDARWYDDLPFNSADVMVTRVTPPEKR